MVKKQTQETQILILAKRLGILQIRDLRERGIHPEHLRRLCAKNLLKKSGRGRYILADADLTENHDLALAAKWVPHGIICLLSALRYHEIGTQLPHEVWMALEQRVAKPRIDVPPLHVVRYSGKAFTEGVEKHVIEGVCVKIYSPAKTVADCFKYRNKIGIDVAMEALRECWRAKKCSSNDLWRYAKVCRVANVMRPYMEAIA